jgi:glyoxylase-like metal-dependent hydrolase (beta-lactamase superfamily II)
MTEGDASDQPQGLGHYVERLPGDILQVDTKTAGVSKVTAGYLIPAPRPTLIECGPALSIDAVIEALRRLGLDADDLAYLVVSHIHLDHAGGAGDVAHAFGNAKVVVSEVGARHLIDPERLNASSRRVYGSLMDTIYGKCTPIAEDRIIGVGEHGRLDLGGGRALDLLATPGHAKHHMSMVDSDTGALFVGDSVGVKTPNTGPLRPATPPPDFDLDQALHTLARYRELDPSRIYLAHYGAIDPPQEALEDATERLRAWAEVARQAVIEHNELDHVADTLAARFASDITFNDDDPEAQRRVQILGGYRSNAMGLLRYWGKRLEDARSASDGD